MFSVQKHYIKFMKINTPTLEEKPGKENHELQLNRLSWGPAENERLHQRSPKDLSIIDMGTALFNLHVDSRMVSPVAQQ